MPLKPPAGDAARLHQAAQQLEAIFVKQLVKASKAFTGGEGAGNAVRADFFADTLADALVKGGGVGLTRQIERSLGASGGPPLAPPLAAGVIPRGATRELPDPTDPLAGGPDAPSGAGAHPVTSPFGLRQDPFDGRLARHGGVDLAAGEGEAIRAAAGGIVVRAGARGGYGDAVEIDHGDGVTTLYAHASELLVREGDAVTPGQAIARVGRTGRATGAHLHFEVRQGGRAVDPARALKTYRLRADDLLGSRS